MKDNYEIIFVLHLKILTFKENFCHLGAKMTNFDPFYFSFLKLVIY